MADRCDLCGSDTHSLLMEKGGGSYRRCDDCTFIFAANREDDGVAANDAYFRDHLDDYIRRSQTPRKRRSYVRTLRRFARYRKTGRLLEVGCNVGGFLESARDAGWEPTGIEPSEPCARYARDHRGLDVRTAYLEDAGLPAGHFDVVYSNAVFEHLAAPSRVFAEVARVLRPGGVAFIDTVNWNCYTRRHLGVEWKLADPVVHLCLYTPQTLRRHCEKAGLEVVRISTHGVRFRPHSAPRPRGIHRWLDELRKFPLSAATRFNQQGDSIDVMARRR